MNVDYVADAVPNATVKASPLGGLYFAANISNYTEWLNGTEDGNFDRYLANELHKLYDSKLHPGCVAQHDGDESDCGSVGVMARYIESPLLSEDHRLIRPKPLFVRSICDLISPEVDLKRGGGREREERETRREGER